MDLVDRIWARDASVWTGADEASWLGWLEEPSLIRPKIPAIEEFARQAEEDGFTDVVLAGMGGSSLAPEVFRLTFEADRFHVLDTTHPDAIRALEARLDLARTLFVVSSKSGTTLETRSHLDYFWDKTDGRGEQFVAITDPGSQLEKRALDDRFRAVWEGHPAIGGRYSALSVFGLVPAALMGVDLERLLERTHEMTEACRLPVGNPGLDLGLRLGAGAKEGRDKVLINPTPGGFGLWVEQLIAESTGKNGKGLVPAPGGAADGRDSQSANGKDFVPALAVRDDGPDRQREVVRISDPYELGQEFFRWEFATAVAGSLIGINPFDQPDVQAAKDRTNAILDAGDPPRLEPEGSVDELIAQGGPGDYFCVQAFVEPTREAAVRIEMILGLARSAGMVTTAGFGPRYLHSTGQLHKGGPPSGLYLQIVDEPEELPIPGRTFGFGQLIRAQAAGDFEALRERGRRVARIRWEKETP